MKVKRLLSFIVTGIMMFSLLTIFPIDTSKQLMPLEANAAGLSLAELQAKFPHGKYWNHAGSSTNNPDGYTSTPCNHHGNCSKGGTDYSGSCGCNSFSSSIQCMGFANKLAYDAFGSSYKSWSKTTLSNLKPGDVIRYKNNGHSIFVTAVNGDTITYGDCNSDGHCKIMWNKTISKATVSASLTGVYSAPASFKTNFFDFWGVDEGITINGTYKLWFKQEGYGTGSNCDVNLYIDGKESKNAVGTIYQDEGGFFSYPLDTTKYSEGSHTIYAVIRNIKGEEKWVSRNINISGNPFFDFWGVDNGITINNTYKLWFKQVGYGEGNKCDVNLYIDGKESKNAIGTIYQDEGGFFSYPLDTTKFKNGSHTIYAVIRNTAGKEVWKERKIVIANTTTTTSKTTTKTTTKATTTTKKTTTTTKTTTKATTTTKKTTTTTNTTTKATTTTKKTTTTTKTTTAVKVPVVIPENLTLQIGDTAELVVLNCDNPENITWISSNKNVAQVKDGVVSGISAGETTIYAVVNNVYCEAVVIVEEKVSETRPTGDTNCDGQVYLNDAVLILQYLGNPDAYPLSDEAKANADVSGNGDGITNKDALAIQRFVLHLIPSLPESS